MKEWQNPLESIAESIEKIAKDGIIVHIDFSEHTDKFVTDLPTMKISEALDKIEIMDTKSKLTNQGRNTRAEYQREWRRKNKDKCRIYSDRYWSKRGTKQTKENEFDDNDNSMQISPLKGECE